MQNVLTAIEKDKTTELWRTLKPGVVIIFIHNYNIIRNYKHMGKETAGGRVDLVNLLR
jgi:hypothetical protein